jgi:hypothetical protein
MLHHFLKRAAVQPVERRRDLRHAIVQEIAKISSSDGEELCIIRDVSPGGLKAEVYRSIAEGSAVRVELRTGRTVTGRIAWARGDHVGVAFDEQVPISAILTHCSFDPRIGTLRAPRVAAELRGKLRIDFHDIAIRVQNISQGGLKITADAPVRAGSRCQVEVDGLPLRPATVVWWRQGEGGLLLQRSLNFSEFAAWRLAS